MLSQDRVTWLLPIKNGLPYLELTLQSIADQTYKNCEILAWDNGSTDGTLELLKSWIPSRIPGRIVSDRPAPLGQSLAMMVQECSTPLCARIDADDLNLPERLEVQTDFLARNLQVDVLGSQMFLIDPEGRLMDNLFRVKSAHHEIVINMLVSNDIAHPSTLFRREAVLDCGNYQSLPEWNGCTLEDADLWMRMASAGKIFANLQIPLVKYRLHPGSSTRRAIREDRMEAASKICFQSHAARLWGISEAEAGLMRERELTFAFPVFQRITRHLGSLLQLERPWRSHLLLDNFSRLVNRRDLVTRTILGAMRRW